MGMYTLLYLKWIRDKDLLYSTRNSAQCYVAAGMGGEFRGEWIHVYVWLSPFPVLLKLSDCYLAIPQYWRRKQKPAPVFLLGNSMGRGAWRAIGHGVTKSLT